MPNFATQTLTSSTSPDDTSSSPNRAALPRFGLFAWINLGVVATALLIVVPLLFLVESFAHRYAARQAGDALSQIAWQMRDSLDRGMSERYEDMWRMANSDMFVGPVNGASVRRSLERLQESSPAYAWIGLTDTTGKVLASTGGLLEGVDVSARPWFKGAAEKPFVGDVHPAVLLAAKLPKAPEPWRFVDIAMPVKTSDGKAFGVLGAHLSWGWARAMQQALIEPRLRSLNTDIWIVKPDGEVLLGPVGRDAKKLKLASLDAAVAGQRGYMLEKWPDGKIYATSYVRTEGHGRYPGLGWIVLARQPQSVAFAAFAELQRRLLIASVAGLGLILLMANFFARRIARPLRALALAADQHGAGSLDAPIPLADDYREAFVLSRAVSGMVDAEKRHSAEVEAINASLEARVDERTAALHEANEHLGRALIEQAAAENAARESEAMLTDILRNANEGYVSMNGSGIVTAWNPEAERIFGWTAEEAVGQKLADMIIPPQSRSAHASGMAHFQKTGTGPIINKRVELVALRRDGSEFPIELTTSVLRRGDDYVISGLIQDISTRKAIADELARQALQDALTGLPNRRALLERLPHAMTRAQRWRKPMALLFLDLDGFKKINDTLGHEAGDEVLRQFAKRLESCVRQSDTVARLAGDEFTILLEALTSGEEDACAVAGKIIRAMAPPFTLGQQELHVSTSIGIAMQSESGAGHIDAWLTRADAAMYVAKRSGKNRWHIGKP